MYATPRSAHKYLATTYVWAPYMTVLLLLSTAVIAHRSPHATGPAAGSGHLDWLSPFRHQNPPRLIASKKHSHVGYTYKTALLLLRPTATITQEVTTRLRPGGRERAQPLYPN